MKQGIIVIFLMTGMFLNSCSSLEPTTSLASIERTATTETLTLYNSIYFRPPNDTIVSDSVLNKYDMHSVRSTAEAMAVTQKIDVIYIHAQMVAAVDRNWLQAQYASGATIVGINIPVSVLGEMIDIIPGVADLKPLDEGFYISMFHHVYDKDQKITGGGVYTEYYSSFDDIPLGINTILELNGRIP